MYVSIYMHLRGASLSRHRRHESHLRSATRVQGAAPYVTNIFLTSSPWHTHICIYVCTSSRRFATTPSSPSTAPLPRDPGPRCGSLRDEYIVQAAHHTHIYIYLCTSSRRFATKGSSPPTAPSPRDQSPRCGSLRDVYLQINRPITHIYTYMYLSMYVHLRGGPLPSDRRHQPHLCPTTGVQGTALYCIISPQAEGVLLHVFDNRSRVCG